MRIQKHFLCSTLFALTFVFTGTLQAQSSVPAAKDSPTILAKYKGGVVTDLEINTLLRLVSRGSHKNKPTKIAPELVRKFALMKIGALEARGLGLHQQPRYKNRLGLVDAKARLDSYKMHIQESGEEQKFKFIEIQFLFLRQRTSVLKKLPSREPEAKRLLAKLNSPGLSESDINNIVTDKTEKNAYKAISGYQIPMCISCVSYRTQFLTDPLQKAQGKEFVFIPATAGGIWLIRRLGTRTLKGEEIETYFKGWFTKTSELAKLYMAKVKDPKKKPQITRQIPLTPGDISARSQNFSDYLRKRELKHRYSTYIKKKKKQAHFKEFKASNPDLYGNKHKKSTLTPETPLFALNGKTFTYGDLSKKLPIENGDLESQMRGLQSVLIDYEILKHDVDFEKKASGPLYIFLKDALEMNLLNSLYFEGKLTKSTEDARLQEKRNLENSLSSKYELNITP